MKVRCIDNYLWPDHLTCEKIYELLDTTGPGYCIEDDKGKHYRYAESLFERISERCFIIVVLPDKDGEQENAELSTRKTFSTKELAEKYISFWAECFRERALIVECPKGLTY